MMEGYKAFGPGWVCRGFQYEIGKTYKLKKGETLEMCRCGFHFCKNLVDVFGYYPLDESTLIAEVIALGEIRQEGTKYVTDKIKIVRLLTREELQKLIRDDYYNSGSHNTGDYNSGSCNSGSCNSGDFNTGRRNSGDRNTGDFNTGNCNTGLCNAGNHNSGIHNSGNYNAGDYNSGNCNTGNYNSGTYNAGDYNSGNYNSGIFNTDEPYMKAFNKPTDIRYSDFIGSLSYDFFGMCERIFKKELDQLDPERIKALPNFDAEIFKEITGIDLKDYEEGD